MPRLSLFFKGKIIELHARGLTYRQIQATLQTSYNFKVNLNTIGFWVRRFKNEESLDVKKRANAPCKIDKDAEDALVDFVMKDENRFMTRTELLTQFSELNCTPQTIANHLKKRGIRK